MRRGCDDIRRRSPSLVVFAYSFFSPRCLFAHSFYSYFLFCCTSFSSPLPRFIFFPALYFTLTHLLLAFSLQYTVVAHIVNSAYQTVATSLLTTMLGGISGKIWTGGKRRKKSCLFRFRSDWEKKSPPRGRFLLLFGEMMWSHIFVCFFLPSLSLSIYLSIYLSLSCECCRDQVPIQFLCLLVF